MRLLSLWKSSLHTAIRLYYLTVATDYDRLILILSRARSIIIIEVLRVGYCTVKLGQCIETVGIIPAGPDAKSQNMSNPVDLYYIPASPPCRNVLLVARAVGINLNLKTVNIMEGEHMTPEFLKMNPEHTIPTINDNGLIVWESRPIMTYLIDMYSKDAEIQELYPKDIKKRVIVDQRLYFDACTLYKSVVEYFGPIIRGVATSVDDMQKFKIEENFSILDKILESQNWVAVDHLTVADISILVTVDTAEAVGIDVAKFGNVSGWLQRCRKEMSKHGYEEIEKVGANMLGQFFKSKLSD